MPRPLRLEDAGAIYHVMNRGDLREVIVRDWRDREHFLSTLGEASAKTGWQAPGRGRDRSRRPPQTRT
jgi:putative transposase